MLKVVVFDNGYGGEFFADALEEILPIIEVVRIIDWRHASEIQASPRQARRLAKAALLPYIGKVDLIVIANYLVSVTSLKYFRRRYKNQHFIGLKPKIPDTPCKKETIILATKAITKTIGFHNYRLRLHRRSQTVILDSWPAKIDDGELTEAEIEQTLSAFIKDKRGTKEVVLVCSQFYDLKPALRKIFGHNLKIYDGFDDTLREACKVLKVRGSAKKLK